MNNSPQDYITQQQSPISASTQKKFDHFLNTFLQLTLTRHRPLELEPLHLTSENDIVSSTKCASPHGLERAEWKSSISRARLSLVG
ncbi:hypothetical protein FGO68_gene13089 [Halteria grandinella]|uniref:Uncharacterized protein n=1 Tax=Halteria grandinella TaxID=5974 RepID=A0A8J8NLW0_HALGN|nr:hypothetical protein FGO68_gene13089 [Halteria grandinella]